MPLPPKLLHCEDIEGGITVVTINDEKVLNEQRIRMLREQLFQLVRDLGKNKILLDFKKVVFFSSAGLQTLISLHREVERLGGKLVFCSICPHFYDLLKITKLHTVFDIQSDLPSGIKVFA